MGRWLGIDHGTKQIGVAVGSTEQQIASGLTAIPAVPQDSAIQKIWDLASEYQVDGIVVGWPLNMDDSEGPQGRLARAMAAELARATGMEVRLWDERLSSFAAAKALAAYPGKMKKARQDAAAAAIILQDFLDAGGPDSAPRPDQVDGKNSH